MKTDSKQEVKVLADQVSRIYGQIIELTVTNELELKHAADVLVLVKSNAKELKAKKKAILDPLKQAMDEVKALFKNPEEQLAKAEATIKDAMLAFHEAQDAAAQKKMEQINGRLERGTMKVETGIAKLAGIDQAETNIQTEGGGVQFREGQQKVKIVNASMLISARPDLLHRGRVLEALRLEIALDVKAGISPPRGVEVYREKIVAGTAKV